LPAFQIKLPDAVHARLQARALENGFEKVEKYIEELVVADIAGPTASDEEIEALLLSRIDGPTVKMDHADFEEIRRKFRKRLDKSE
jgi:hypothetical protein